jgi:hypothetical protein
MSSPSEAASSSSSFGAQSSNTVTLSPLASLPPEIVTRIFESLEEFDSAVSFASCSKFFATIFSHHKPSIARNILPHDPIVNGTTISFYGQAIALLVAQQKTTLGEDAAEAHSESPSLTRPIYLTRKSRLGLPNPIPKIW